MNKIMVIGSISTDFNVSTNKLPTIGETVKGEDFSVSFGGKGANQAIAASRLGADVKMVGTVGDDIFGSNLIRNLVTNNINTEHVLKIKNQSSGSAHISLFNNDNSIIYIPGANNEIHSNRIDKLKNEILKMDIVILQNEIPLNIVEKIIDLCYELEIETIYNPAPAETINIDVIEKVTYFTPNESEFNVIFPDLTVDEALRRYSNKMIVTLGSRGVAYCNGEKIIEIPSFEVDILDTTGAGDTFNGALAFALTKDISLESSIKFANLAAAISIGKKSAQPGMPTLLEVQESEYYEEKWDIK